MLMTQYVGYLFPPSVLIKMILCTLTKLIAKLIARCPSNHRLLILQGQRRVPDSLIKALDAQLICAKSCEVCADEGDRKSFVRLQSTPSPSSWTTWNGYSCKGETSYKTVIVDRYQIAKPRTYYWHAHKYYYTFCSIRWTAIIDEIK